MTRIIGIIPARYGSTRFPAKALVDIRGKSMIQRVYEQASKAKLDAVLIATDHEKIFDHAQSFGAKVYMTSTEHPSGTDRCEEALRLSKIPADFVINIQGDEPYIDPSQIDQLADIFKEDPEVRLATLAIQITDPKKLTDPNAVKVVIDKNNSALYFSRHPIPFQRDEKDTSLWLEKHHFYKHIGIYGYKASTLAEITGMQRSSLEISESLEQLRWLENGLEIKVGITKYESPNIDSPADLENLLNNI